VSRERHRVLQLLGGHDWVPSDSLSAEFCQYGRIIYQLRREGFEIINKVVPTRNGGKRGYFQVAVAARVGGVPHRARPGGDEGRDRGVEG
jgi:hypothetical protein